MSCTQKIDAECVGYNLSNPGGASGLYTLNIPNGASLKMILERIDQLFAINNPLASSASFQTAIQALGLQTPVNTTADLLNAIASSLAAAKQSVLNIQAYTQSQVGNMNAAISGYNSPAVAAGPVDVTDTLRSAIEKLGHAIASIETLMPKLCCDSDNTLLTGTDGGWYVAPYEFRVSQLPGNILVEKPDGYYVNNSTNGLTTEQLMEQLVNAGLNADPSSTLVIKLKQLIQTYLS